MSADWYEDRNNLAAVARYMGERGDTVEDVAYMLEKPQKFEDDWRGVLVDESFAAMIDGLASPRGGRDA